MSNFFELKRPKPLNLPLEVQRQKWMSQFFKAFSVVFMVYFASYMIRQNMNAASLAMTKDKDLGLNMKQLANLLTFHSIAYGIGKLILGFLADRKNTKKLISFLVVIGGLCNVLIGILFFSTKNVTIITLGTAILWGINGFVLSPGGPCAFSTIMRWQPKSKQATWLSRWNISHNVGGAIAAPFAAMVAAKFFSNNVGGFFILPGLLAIGIGAWGISFGYDDPKELGWDKADKVYNEVDNEAELEEEAEEKTQGEELSKWQIFLKYVITNPWILIVCFANIFVYILRMGITKWIIVYAGTQLPKSDIAQVSTLLMYIEFTAIIGSLFFGWLTDKLKGRRMIVSGIITLSLSGGILIYQNAKSYGQLAVAMCICGFLFFGPQLLIGISVVKFAPKKAIAVANGLSGTFGYLLGDVLALQLIGRLVGGKISKENADKLDFTNMFIVLIVSAIIGTILMFIAAIGEERNIRKEQALKKNK
ncbi:MAG: MFS transporter [Lactobacillales bacterium]|jgi:OPA family hexose phosphate transport protein UhpT-like MFS transporter|nr:MFS transporter [Lactobacillales bacterium]